MADLSITPANVVPGTDATVVTGTYGETITAGMSVYLKTADTRYWKAQSDTVAKATCKGIAINSGSAGQPAAVQTRGSITIGATVAVGTSYYVSGTAGGLQPVGDLGAGEYTSHVAIGDTTATLVIGVVNSGAAHA